MSELLTLRENLERRLERLVLRAGAIGANLRKPQASDWQERAIQVENDEVLEGLDVSTAEEVRQIQSALARIDEGTYGRCAQCDNPIGAARLQAMPQTTSCIACAS